MSMIGDFYCLMCGGYHKTSDDMCEKGMPNHVPVKQVEYEEYKADYSTIILSREYYNSILEREAELRRLLREAKRTIEATFAFVPKWESEDYKTPQIIKEINKVLGIKDDKTEENTET